MIIAFFENSNEAEFIGAFNNEETYKECVPALKKMAEAKGMILTEAEATKEEVSKILNTWEK